MVQVATKWTIVDHGASCPIVQVATKWTIVDHGARRKAHLLCGGADAWMIRVDGGGVTKKNDDCAHKRVRQKFKL
eukprot:gene2993-5782_t